ncbi:hypothetical protein [Cellulosimicrobium cellulans]|uniref:hypothetical protein n=1 Tax=Cellulosimicrobium cellulans TaxID=1710 RepID=UPI0024054C9B|nr:hypothetical protein [Cellulosimicrobium cellulans]MDF9877556.1 hypothetical protein [Cellulosimicrobium cellulans]
MRRVLITVAVLLAALAPCAPASADSAPDEEPSTPHACSEALALVDGARPGDAQTLIDAYRSSSPPGSGATEPDEDRACDDAYAAAGAAISTAQELADDARLLVPGGEPPASGTSESWAAATARAEQALAIDEQNVTATEVLQDAPQAATERVGRAWRTFVESVEPLGTPLLALGVAVLVLAVLARATLPTTLHWPVLSARQRCVATVAGWVALVSGAALLVWGPAAATAPWPTGDARVGGVVTGVLVLATLGAGIAAVWLARDVRGGLPPHGMPASGWTSVLTMLYLATIVLGAVGLTATVLDVAGVVELGLVGTLLPGAAAAGVGVLLTGTVLATRLRLTVDTTSDSGSRSSSEEGTGGGHLVALLAELGAEPPRGLETPTATDINTLGGSTLTELPQQAFAKAALTVVQWLLGSVPWRVRVEVTGPDHLSVVVTRNGRAAGSAVVDRARILGSETKSPEAAEVAAKVDLHRAAAAVVLMTLSRHHPGFEGLCGATEWRSLALYYVAQTDLAARSEHKRSLLARAVGLDPANDLAQVAFANATARRDTTREDLDEYRRWLDAFVGRTEGLDGYRSLRLRALYSRAVVATNACFAAHRDTRPPLGHLDAGARRAVRELLAALGEERTAGREDALVHRLRDAAETMYHQAMTSGPGREGVSASRAGPPDPDSVQRDALRVAYTQATGEEPGPLTTALRFCATPTGDYNLACTYAIRRPLQDVDARRATEHLRRAVELPGMLDWLHKDPMLAAYRGRQEYLDEFGTDPLGLLDVQPFARHADALRSVGLTTTGRILARRRPVLTTDLRTTPEVATELRAAAHLVEDLPEVRGRHDVAEVLLAHHVTSVDPAHPRLPSAVVTAVLSRLGRTRLDQADRERWSTWLGRA